MGLLWITPFIWLRGTVTLRHSASRTVRDYAMRNLTDFEWQFYALAFAGVWFVVPLLGWKHLSRPLRRLIVMMVPYLGLVLAFGRIREVRLLLPTTVAFVPAAMVVLNAWLKQDTERPLNQLSPFRIPTPTNASPSRPRTTVPGAIVQSLETVAPAIWRRSEPVKAPVAPTDMFSVASVTQED